MTPEQAQASLRKSLESPSLPPTRLPVSAGPSHGAGSSLDGAARGVGVPDVQGSLLREQRLPRPAGAVAGIGGGPSLGTKPGVRDGGDG